MSQGSVGRELLHKRDFAFEGYLRPDGHYDIEGRMTDRKTYAFPNDFRGEIQADEPLHDMRIRVTIDETFRILDVVAETAAGPFAACPAITPTLEALKGAQIGRGWTRLLREKFGGVKGCTHHLELLRTLATVAFQTVHGEEMRRQRAGRDTPRGPAGNQRKAAGLDRHVPRTRRRRRGGEDAVAGFLSAEKLIAFSACL